MRNAFLYDTGIIMTRELRPVLRDPFSVIFAILQPLVFLALFGPLLAGVEGVPSGHTWQWFVPGVLVMVVLFGTTTVGSNLQEELKTGAHERLMVTPLGRAPQLVGRALKELVPLVVQALIVIAVMLPFGFTADPLGTPAGLVLLGAAGLGVGALSYALAIAVRAQEWVFWGVQQTVLFPVLLTAGVLLPLDGGPGWLVFLGKVNPLTYVIEALRALFVGAWGDPAIVAGAVAAGGIAVVGLTIGVRAMRRMQA